MYHDWLVGLVLAVISYNTIMLNLLMFLPVISCSSGNLALLSAINGGETFDFLLFRSLFVDSSILLSVSKVFILRFLFRRPLPWIHSVSSANSFSSVLYFGFWICLFSRSFFSSPPIFKFSPTNVYSWVALF